MNQTKWSNPKGKINSATFKHTGFKTNLEMRKYISQHKLNVLGLGYNDKDKHFFLYKFGD